MKMRARDVKINDIIEYKCFVFSSTIKTPKIVRGIAIKNPDTTFKDIWVSDTVTLDSWELKETSYNEAKRINGLYYVIKRIIGNCESNPEGFLKEHYPELLV